MIECTILFHFIKELQHLSDEDAVIFFFYVCESFIFVVEIVKTLLMLINEDSK